MPPRAQSSVSVPDRLTAWLGPRAREGILGACFTRKAALHCPWCESPDSPSPCNPSLARCRECREKDAGLCSSGILYLNKSVNIMRHLTYGRHQSWPLSRIPWLLQATCDSLALAPYPLSLCRHRGCELSHAPEAAQGHGRAGLGQSWGSWPASAQGEETEQKPQPQAALREGSPGQRQREVGRQGPGEAGTQDGGARAEGWPQVPRAALEKRIGPKGFETCASAVISATHSSAQHGARTAPAL